jgi:hypothetical protein
MAHKYTSVTGHFNGYVEALKQYMQHHPMQHVLGYTGSHWMLPSGDYSVRIAPVATRATANKTSMKNVPTFLVVSMAVVVRQYNTMHIA